MKPVLMLVRGLPGSGKNTLAARLGANSIIAADDWFERYNTATRRLEYRFDPAGLGDAHDSCQARARNLVVGGGFRIVAVCNTFTQEWEIAPYRQIAAECDATLVIVSLFDAGLTDAELAARNVHGVPEAAIARMRARWEKVA